MSAIFGTGRGVESLSKKVLSLFLRNHFVGAICRHSAVYNDGVGSGLPEPYSFVLCSG